MIDKSDRVEVQVKVPMSLTILIPRQQAELLFRDQLAEVIDGILSQCATEELQEVQSEIEIVAGELVEVEYRIDPYWDNTPEDEVEFIYVEDDMFPEDNSGDEHERN
jgi:hypothetical protein